MISSLDIATLRQPLSDRRTHAADTGGTICSRRMAGERYATTSGSRRLDADTLRAYARSSKAMIPTACRSTASPSPSRTTSTWPALPTTAGCPEYRLHAGRHRHRGAAPDRRRRDPARQDQPRPVRHRPGRHALALRRLPQRLRPRLHLRRLQLRLGRRRGAGPGELRLGTDTAGSGRVPAAFNNLVGLKPTLRRAVARAAWCRPAARSMRCRSSR